MAQNECIQSGCRLQLANILLLLILFLNSCSSVDKIKNLPQEYFLSLLHLLSHGDLDTLDAQFSSYTTWHMVNASICALLECTVCPNPSLVS